MPNTHTTNTGNVGTNPFSAPVTECVNNYSFLIPPVTASVNTNPFRKPPVTQIPKTALVSSSNNLEAVRALDLMFNSEHVPTHTAPSAAQDARANCPHACNKDKVETHTFNGRDKWDTFISLFEKVAEINNWEGSDKCKGLMVALRGSALEFVDTLQFKVTKDFEQLKAALASRFGVTSNVSLYRVKFKGRRRNENETLDHFMQDLQYLAERAYPTEKGEIYHRL